MQRIIIVLAVYFLLWNC